MAAIDIHALRVRSRRAWRNLASPVKRLAFAVLVCVLHAWLLGSSMGQGFEHYLLDTWFSIRGPIEPPDKVVLISINNSSYGRDYDGIRPSNLKPWPRPLIARLLNQLSREKPSRLILDFFYIEHVSDEVDKELAAAMKKVPVVIGRHEKEVLRYNAEADKTDREIAFNEPQQIFEDSAFSVVTLHLNITSGEIRYISRLRRLVHERLPMVKALEGLLPDGFELPGQRDFINYYGPQGSIITVPFEQVLMDPDSLPQDFFRDKIVLVGWQTNTSALPVGKDSFPTPYSEAMVYGVEIHATVAANLIEGNWIRRIQWEKEVVLLTVLAIIAVLVITQESIFAAACGLVILTGLWGAVSYVLFLRGYFLSGFSLFGVILPSVFVACLVVRFYLSIRARKQVEESVGLVQAKQGEHV